MRIERLSQDKIRIFLTFDDLSERGIQKEDMWQEVPKVHDLFTEMMDQAYNELGFDATGPLAVEVFALPAQGMVVIVTRGKYDHHYGASGEEELPDEIYEMEVTLEQADSIVYTFRDFEVVVEAAHVLIGNITSAGKLYSYNNKWYLYFDPKEFEEPALSALVAVLAEFGDSSPVTETVLDEYGKTVMAENAVQQLCAFFKRQE
ncbi:MULTISPECIES: genetic competence negative regulator [Paenibacillus]|uniref:Genetic competence negative regulator n=1 Tax=Paenibacillus rhizophilus TaxID=1850366 RepID=A0A3N9P9J2_9BACL|nr:MULTISPECIES: genetic competence negative regulator [Paenibacillus]RQW12908.1 genetic competence negative regulator [Paenibacillus rhizophilus]BCG59946.1 adapter protein MecA [Paenibacillus sp. URB8-2]